MNYSTSAILKAVVTAVVAFIGAGTAAANGPDLSHLQLDQWLTALGTALLAGAALLHKPDKKQAPLDKANSTVTDVVTSAVEAHQSLTQQAVDSIKKVQEATGDLASLLPGPLGSVAGSAEGLIVNQVEKQAERVLGPLASQVIGLVPKF